MNKITVNTKSILCVILTFCMFTSSVQPIYANGQIPQKLTKKEIIIAAAVMGTLCIGAFVVCRFYFMILSSIAKKIFSKKKASNGEDAVDPTWGNTTLTYISKISKLNISQELKTNLRNEASQLKDGIFGSINPVQSTITNHLNCILSLPWEIATKDKLDLSRAKEILNQDHFGMEEVKDKILNFIALKMLCPESKKATILCLVGPPGTGKTSICKSIATCLGKKYARVALGGVSDEPTIRGHIRTYAGAMPGRIMKGLQQAGSINPVIVLDEIDKINKGLHGDPAAALLEVLDPNQNKEFCDHYVEAPFDLSKVIFIATANYIEQIPEALKDRMEIVELPGYTNEEKLNIAKNHLLKDVLKDFGLENQENIAKFSLNDKNFGLSDDVLNKIIIEYAPEPGVRGLNRQIQNLLTAQIRAIAEKKELIKFTPDNIGEYLGKPKKAINTANNNVNFLRDLFGPKRENKIENKKYLAKAMVKETPKFNRNKAFFNNIERKRANSLNHLCSEKS